MAGLKLRIGGKLGLSAAVGVVLVTALIVNDRVVTASRHEMQKAIAAGHTTREAIAATDLLVRRILIVNRDLRLANNVAGVDDVLKRLATISADGLRNIDTASQLVVVEVNKNNIAQARRLFEQYSAATGEIGTVQKEMLAARGDQSALATDWNKLYAAVMALPALDGLRNRVEVEHALTNADLWYKDSRLILWAYLSLGTDTMPDRIRKSLEKTIEVLKGARSLTTEPTIVAEIDRLLTFAPKYRENLEKILSAQARQAAIIRDRADPARKELDTVLQSATKIVGDRIAATDAQAAAEEWRANAVTLGLGLLVVSLLIGSAVFSMLSIARPIRRIGDVLLQLAGGNKAVDIPYATRGDEVGDNARAAQTFKENLVRMEQMEAEQKAADERAAAQRKSDMHKLANEFERAVGGIVEAVSSSSTELEAAARTLTQTADTTMKLSGVVAEASEEASANVESVASATEELTSSVNEIARQVQESARIAGEAVTQAQRTDTRVTALLQAAGRIGDVVKLITAVAEQTNLLALNATIEAARAGEAGRGFAVVAQEVKALAAQTAKATDEISTQIAGMQSATEDSVTAIKEIGATIARISGIAATIAAAVEQQGAATQEIARNVQQAAQGTQQVAANIGDVNRGAGETGTASSQVLSSAQSLSVEGNKLKTEVDRFLDTVRAA